MCIIGVSNVRSNGVSSGHRGLPRTHDLSMSIGVRGWQAHMVIVALVACVAALLAGCRSSGTLEVIEDDPMVSQPIVGAVDVSSTSDAGGTTLGKDTPARLSRLLELDGSRQPGEVLDDVIALAVDAGWDLVRIGHTSPHSARLVQDSGGTVISLFVDVSDPPELSLYFSGR